jgi:hypothetical protein
VPAERVSLEVLTNTLGVPLGTAKAMVFKKRGLLAMGPGELLDRVRTVADVVGVTTDQAIEMVTIQPGLLFDTQVGPDRGGSRGQRTALGGSVGAGDCGAHARVSYSLEYAELVLSACLWLRKLPERSCGC